MNIRPNIAFVLSLLILLSACSDGGGASGPVPGPETPVVIAESDPANNAADVDLGKTVTLTFSVLPPESAVTNSNFTLTRVAGDVPVPGTLAIDPENRTVTFTPAAALTAGMQYDFIVKKEALAAEADTTVQFTSRQTPWLFVSRQNSAESPAGFCANLWTMNPDGSSKRQLTYYQPVDNGNCSGWILESANNAVSLSPAQRQLAYVVSIPGPVADVRLILLNLETLERKQIVSGFVDSAMWSPDGTRLFFKLFPNTGPDSVSSIYSVNSDGTGLTALISDDATSVYSILSVSMDGTKLLIISLPKDSVPPAERTSKLYSFNIDGASRQELASYQWPIYILPWAEFSGDGSKVYYRAADPNSRNPLGAASIYSVSPDGGNGTKISDAAWGGRAVFSPNGRMLVFEGGNNIWIANTDGTPNRQLTNFEYNESTRTGESVSLGKSSWSPDGSKILFEVGTRESGGRSENLHIINVDGTGLKKLTDYAVTNSSDSDLGGYFWDSDSTGVYAIYISYQNMDSSSQRAVGTLFKINSSDLTRATLMDANSEYELRGR